jgi:hypothetical protein
MFLGNKQPIDFYPNFNFNFSKVVFFTIVRSQNQSKVAVKSKVLAMTSNLTSALTF